MTRRKLSCEFKIEAVKLVTKRVDTIGHVYVSATTACGKGSILHRQIGDNAFLPAGFKTKHNTY